MLMLLGALVAGLGSIYLLMLVLIRGYLAGQGAVMGAIVDAMEPLAQAFVITGIILALTA